MVCSVCRYDVHMLYVWGVITVVCVGGDYCCMCGG